MGLISSLWQFREVLWLPLFIRQETEHVQVIKIFRGSPGWCAMESGPRVCTWDYTLREDMKDLYSFCIVRGALTYSFPTCFPWSPSIEP